LASAAIYGVPAGLVAGVWQTNGMTRIYTDVAALPLWWLPVSYVVCLLLQDTWFYWTHRLMHSPVLFGPVHSVHHASRPPTAWTAMSFHPWEAVTGAVVVPAVVFILPLHAGVVLAWLLTMTIMGTTNHMGWEFLPQSLVKGPLGKCMISATHHQLHHDRYSCNYGLYFRFWDYVCGTDRGLGHFDIGKR
jgi:Delta7-sterol 5-desaturase